MTRVVRHARTEACFRVWLTSRLGRQYAPVIQATDVAGVRDKVQHLYPGSELLEITPLHDASDAEHAGMLGYRSLRPRNAPMERRSGERRAVPA